jgi:hypothetical protein
MSDPIQPLPPGFASFPEERHVLLWNTLMEAHLNAAINNLNASREVAVVAFQGSGSMAQALAAGLLTTGLRHAPLAAARDVLLASPEEIEQAARDCGAVPGFGNSFYPSGDLAFVPVGAVLEAEFPEWHARICAGREALLRGLQPLKAAVGGHEPNAGLYTAVVCEVCQVPRGAELVVFLLPRIGVWALEALKR